MADAGYRPETQQKAFLILEKLQQTPSILP
jgi:hypothetical protein